MEIIKLDFEEKLLRKFVNFSWNMYKNDSFWIPPFKKRLIRSIQPQNSFFEYGEIKHFMAIEKNDVLGRISAIINRRAVEDTTSIGYLGFFESLPDFSITEKLLSEAIGYLGQRGIKKIRAPINFSTWYKYRFMTKGFEESPFYLEPYNCSYYPVYFERYGFKKTMLYMSNLLENFDDQIKGAGNKLREFSKKGFTTRRIDFTRVRSELRLLYELSTKCFNTSWGYTEIHFSEFLNIYDGFQNIVDSDFILFAYDQDKKPIGFIFCIPNYAAAIRSMNGRTDIFARLRFLRNKRKPDTLIVKTIGVVPEARQFGVGSVLMGLVHKTAREKGYQKVIHALMRQDNYIIRKISEKGGKVFKEYAVYELNL